MSEDILNKGFVIGDVHGCYHTLISLLSKLPDGSIPIFVGDLCDRGLFSKEVIELVSSNNYLCVLGNHDEYMRDELIPALEGKEDILWVEHPTFAGKSTLQNYQQADKETIERHLKWINNLPPFLEIGKFFITHSFGLPFYKRREEKEYFEFFRTNRITNIKNITEWESDFDKYDVINIFGHDTFEEVLVGENYYGIDTGSGSEGGKLTAISLKDFRVLSVNINPEDLSV